MAAALLVAGPACAIDRHVPATYATIQEAINASSNGDTVILAPGTYSGIGNQNLDFGGRVLTLESSDGAAATRIEPTAGHRGFVFDDGEGPLARVVGITVTLGNTNSSGGSAAIMDATSPTFIDCTFSFCQTTGWGGAIRVDLGAPTFSRCRFIGNSAARGGAVYFDSGVAVFIDCEFTSNSAVVAGGATNHGAQAPSDVTYTRCTFNLNSAPMGGACMFEDGRHDAQLLNCRFIANRGNELGGAVQTGTGFAGGATNCLFLYNLGANDGRAWFDNGADRLELINCTMLGHTPSDSDKNAVVLARAKELTIANTIIWDNGGTAINAVDATVAHVHHSCVEGGYAGRGNVDLDPLLSTVNPFAPTPMPGSPCRDEGDDDALPPTIVLDIDGAPRRIDGDANGTVIVDMGAFEAPELPCLGDLDDDDAVGFGDLVLVLAAWGPCPACPEDLDGNGAVEFDDVLLILARWGDC